MCVIAFVPKGVETPNKETITAMYMANRDGCGCADGNGNVLKTLSFKKLMKQIEKRTTDTSLLLHFRIATQGSVKVRNCHPFVDDKTGIIFAHNGCLSMQPKNDKTDSEIFFRDYFLHWLHDCNGNINDPLLWQQVDAVRNGSRLVFLQGNEATFAGNWQKIDGVFYSNTYWQYRLNNHFYEY